MTRVNNTCVDEVPSVMCTKLFCCATVGQGWGHPCEECPARVGNCSKGRLPPHCQGKVFSYININKYVLTFKYFLHVKNNSMILFEQG